MGIKAKITIIIVAFFSSCVPAFSSSSGKILHSDHLQGITKYETGCGTRTAHPEKFGSGHSSGGRGGGREASVGGGHPNDDGSKSSYMQGGSATMPLYTTGTAAGAAAAANDHRNYHRNHSGSNRYYNCVEVVTLSCTILASLLIHQGM